MSGTPDMLTHLGGVPVGSARYSNPWATHYFVDDIGGSDANDGSAPDRSKKTVQAAITAASAGDVIYINPMVYVDGQGAGRYDEILTVPVATTDLSIIGVRNFNNTEFGVRLYSASANYVLTSAAAVLHLENLAFFANTSAYGSVNLQQSPSGYSQRNDGATLYNCNFKGGTTAKGVYIEGGQATRVIGCVVNHAAAGTLTIAVPDSSGYNQQIRDCIFVDNSGTACVETCIQASGANVYSLVIDNCHFMVIPSTNAYYINCTGAQSTGLISNCYFRDDDVAIATDLIVTASGIDVVACHDGSGAFVA